MTTADSHAAVRDKGSDVCESTLRLSAALEREQFAGWDPYDALSSPTLRSLARTPLLRRVAIQTLKRLPINPRPLLGIPKQQHAKALALLVSAYARLASSNGAYLERAQSLAELLASRAVEAGAGVGWSYDFDVQTRWGYYRRGEPNAIATSFAAHAFLDLATVDPVSPYVSLADRALDFARSALLVDRGGHRFFGYYAGSRTFVHNANVLVSSLFARREGPESRSWSAAADAMNSSLERQAADGSWPYGEGPGLGWVDGFHTAYVLDAVARWHLATGDSKVEAALLRGLHFARTRLIDPDGAPRAAPSSRYPIDIHAASSLIRTFSELGRYEAAAPAPDTATRVLAWTLDYMRRPDGRFAFQLHRRYRNSVPYIRWSDAHMLLALVCYATRENDDRD